MAPRHLSSLAMLLAVAAGERALRTRMSWGLKDKSRPMRASHTPSVLLSPPQHSCTGPGVGQHHGTGRRQRVHRGKGGA